jgi:hypothetical protein
VKYPIFVPSKGRADRCVAANALLAEGLDFKIVVERAQADAYAAQHGRARLLVMPFDDMGIAAARNFIKEYAHSHGAVFHWMLDDDVKKSYRLNKGKNTPCTFGESLSAIETFVDSYENIAYVGFKGHAFAYKARTAYEVNKNVYSFCSLVRSDVRLSWRGKHEDVDFGLQALTAGWCIVLFNIYNIDNGNPSEHGVCESGHIEVVRALQERWPNLGIKTVERNGRFFPGMSAAMKQFKQPLTPKFGCAPSLPEFTPPPAKEKVSPDQPSLFEN